MHNLLQLLGEEREMLLEKKEAAKKSEWSEAMCNFHETANPLLNNNLIFYFKYVYVYTGLSFISSLQGHKN